MNKFNYKGRKMDGKPGRRKTMKRGKEKSRKKVKKKKWWQKKRKANMQKEKHEKYFRRTLELRLYKIMSKKQF